MNIRKLSLAILTISAIAPVVAFASGEDVALNACAKAFATSVAGGSTAPSFKLNYDRSVGNQSVLGFHVHSYTFSLDAQNRKTGAVTSATCSADTHGEVLALTTTTADKHVTLAAR